MLSVVFICIWQSAIIADRDLGLVSVDEDPRVSMRATAAIASYHAVVSPVDRLLVDELDGRVGLGLKIEVCLLEPGTRHGLLARPLAPGPDLLPVGRLRELRRRLAQHLGHRRLSRRGGCYGLGVQLTGRRCECSRGEA